MATHNVFVNLPDAELRNSDPFFSIYQDRRKLGTITISEGSIEWYPKSAKKPYNMSWTQFDKMIRDWYDS